DPALEAQVPLDGVLEQAADLDEREVRRELVGVERGRHRPSIACSQFETVVRWLRASNSEHMTTWRGRPAPPGPARPAGRHGRKAARLAGYGGPDVLRYEEVDRLRPAAGDVLVRVAGTSFNPLDAALRAGYLQQVFPVTLPHTPGLDVAGTVEALGDGVAGWAT